MSYKECKSADKWGVNEGGMQTGITPSGFYGAGNTDTT